MQYFYLCFMIRLALNYLRYFLFASHRKGHGIHSPFVFSFINEVLMAKDDETIKRLNSQLSAFRKDKKKINTIKIGAGSMMHNSSQRSIGSIVRKSSIRSKYGKLLYKLILAYQPEIILELGTGIGISTSWMAMADKKVELTTVDADLNKLNTAKEIHQKLDLRNIKYINKDFDEFLKDYRPSSGRFLAFIDGNHSYQASLNYYNTLVKYAKEDAILIFDDINWSSGMMRAWKEIAMDTRSVICIDLFFLGIVFFRHGIPKQSFSIKF
jgi:predicted O-methyltransferase YrrM